MVTVESMLGFSSFTIVVLIVIGLGELLLAVFRL